MEKDDNVVSLVEVIESKLAREKQLEEFRAHLDKLKEREFFIKKEIQVAEFVIGAVEQELPPKNLVKELIKLELDDLE
jgi:phosphoribosylaminoimidazole carboxylase (NCAIR synthetase)|tara:strand:- start:1696 stop:1929 length:234 start_codon:yes stop_codon:yes gene_type:complete